MHWMLTKFDLVYLSQSNLINLCARENILVFSSFLCFFLFHILHFFFLNIKVLITEKLKDLEIDNSARFSAMIMGFLLLEQRIRRTFLSLFWFLSPFWITEEMSWLCSLDNKIYFSVTSEYLNLINFPLNPSPFSASQYPWFKVGMQLQGFCMNDFLYEWLF